MNFKTLPLDRLLPFAGAIPFIAGAILLALGVDRGDRQLAWGIRRGDRKLHGWGALGAALKFERAL